MTVTFMVAMVAILKLSPLEVAVASGIASLGALFVDRGVPKHRLVFNAAQSAVAGGLAALVYRGLGGTERIQTDALLMLVVATAAATAVYYLVNTLAVCGAVSISTGARFTDTWGRMHIAIAFSYVAFGGSGIVLAALYQEVNVLALPLLLVPLLVARQAFRASDEVRIAYEETVKAFVSAIEAKDAYTRGHSERVADYCLLIAQRLGMADEELEAFKHGALLHDVGKLIVRKSVLTKPGRLDEDEFAEIKRHPLVGAQIVQEIDFLRPVLDAVLYHHERLDGSGYPAGLVGDMVPKLARIMAVGDTFDAMTSTRAYRSARTFEEAIAELRRIAGSQLDEECVRVFVEALNEETAGAKRPEERYEVEAVPNVAI